MEIYFIYAEGCEDCSKAQREIEDALSESNVNHNMHLYDIEEPEALDIAMQFNIGGDIPSCVILSESGVFETLEGKKISKKRVLKAIQKLSK
jgi:thiol-disulfide isomerase/thioredoxin